MWFDSFRALTPPLARTRFDRDSAWAFFEHFILPRHYTNSKQQGGLRRASRGDNAPTRLYSVWKTPETELADMGIGVGIYFSTLRYLGFVLLLAAVINIPNCRYYNSDDYNHDDQSGIPFVLQRSAICTDSQWVACPSCTRDQWDYFPATFDRYAESDDGQLKFIQINLCSFGYYLGLFNWISIIFCAVAIYIVCFHVIKTNGSTFR